MSRSTETRRERSWTTSDPELVDFESQRPILRLVDPSRRDISLAALYVFLVALATRVVFVIYDGGFGYQPKADSLDFHLIAVSLNGGTGYSRLSADFAWIPTAYRMPLTPLTVAGIYRLFGVNPFAARLVLAASGAAACAMLVGICGTAFGRRTGYRAGLIAGLIAAADPFLIMNQTSILLEPLHVFLVTALVWTAISYRRSTDRLKLVLLAVISALLALNRPDGFAYGLIAAAVVLIPPDPKSRADVAEDKIDTTPTVGRRLYRAASIVIAMLICLGPWAFRNYRALHAFVPLTTASGDLILGANNQATYSPGPFFGYWAYGALTTGEAASYGFAGEVRSDRERRRLALEYMADHPVRALAVLPVRILRGWDLYDPVGNARFGESWGRPMPLSLAALVLYYPGLVLAIWAGYVCRRRWRDLSVLYLLAVYLTVLFATATGEPRYRAGIQIVVWVFAGFAVSQIIEKRRRYA
jgi:hypothetical protein